MVTKQVRLCSSYSMINIPSIILYMTGKGCVENLPEEKRKDKCRHNWISRDTRRHSTKSGATALSQSVHEDWSTSIEVALLDGLTHVQAFRCCSTLNGWEGGREAKGKGAFTDLKSCDARLVRFGSTSLLSGCCDSPSLSGWSFQTLSWRLIRCTWYFFVSKDWSSAGRGPNRSRTGILFSAGLEPSDISVGVAFANFEDFRPRL